MHLRSAHHAQNATRPAHIDQTPTHSPSYPKSCLLQDCLTPYGYKLAGDTDKNESLLQDCHGFERESLAGKPKRRRAITIHIGGSICTDVSIFGSWALISEFQFQI